MGSLRVLPRSFYRRPTAEVARDLLGRYLVHDAAAGRLIVQLVETEAYLGAADRASHAWQGRKTARNASLYLPPGHAYVYFIYGKHFCINAVTGIEGEGGAVLLRAAVAIEGGELLHGNRKLTRPPRPADLAGGPGKLCQALGIDRAQDGATLWRGTLRLTEGEPVPPNAIAFGPRIGIDYAGDAVSWPLRFAVRGHPEVSRPRL